MRIELKTLLGVAGILVATQAGAQVIYERPAVVVQPAPVVISPADQVYQARVISARAVAGAPEQRCWTEQKQIGPIELPGAIITEGRRSLVRPAFRDAVRPALRDDPQRNSVLGCPV